MKNGLKCCFRKLLTTIAFIAVFCAGTLAQTKSNCAEFLKKNIATEDPHNVINNIISEASCFALDSVDLRIFGNGPVIGSMMVKHITESKDSTNYTYADLLSVINAEKRDTGYTAIRTLVLAQMKLEKTSFSPDNWDASKKLLRIIGTPDSEMEAFHTFAIEKQAHHWTYRQLVVAYQMKQESEKSAKQ